MVKVVTDFRGKKIYEPPRFMTVNQAADQLIQVIQRRKEEGEELGESYLTCEYFLSIPYLFRLKFWYSHQVEGKR